ncbi:MAG: threonine ammonia-lyase [Nitrospirae bacterium]|nr:threonine ammonia-lyase [Nitrospirota bacterium]
MLTLSDIKSASQAIKPYIYKTPLIYSDSLSKRLGADVYLKCENLQRTGSFKVRGAFNKIIGIAKGAKKTLKGVITASMGNHAQGVAYAASTVGVKAKVVMPKGVSIVKEEAVRSYGAEVVLYGENLKDALSYANAQKDYTFIHPYDDEDIISGQGSIGIEISDEMDNIDFALVPVGGGGLISGVAVALKSILPHTLVIGIQTESATSALSSFRKKKLIESVPLPTLADGIAVGRVGKLPLKIMQRFVDDMVFVHEGSIAKAILLFLERKKLVVEGAGAVPLAYCLEDGNRFKGKRIVLLISGGNIDFTLIDRIIHRGLIESRRIGIFEVVISDTPGSLHAVTGIISAERGNILNVIHNRLSGDIPIGKTKVQFTVELKNKEHLDKIISALKSKGISAVEI